MKKITKFAPALALLIHSSCGGSSGGGGSAGETVAAVETVETVETVPVGDPTATYGEITQDDAQTFLTTDLVATESLALSGISPEGAASIKSQVGVAPSGGVPAQETPALRFRTPNLLTTANVCTVTTTGDSTDADTDYIAVNQTTTYDCAIDNSATPEFWSWTAKGEWTMKDSDDAVKYSGGRYDIKNYTYSGKYKTAAGVETTYKGSSDGFSDWKKDGLTFTSDVRYAYSYQNNDAAERKIVYVSKSSFVEAAESLETYRQGTLNYTGFVRTETNGKIVILAQEGKDLVVDSAACNYSGFKSGTLSFLDAKGKKLVVTYVNCKRTITLDEQVLTTGDFDEEVTDATMLSCKSFASEGREKGDDAEAAELTMYRCENISINATGVLGTTDEEKMAYLKDICVSGRGQGATYRTQATVGKLCPKPKEKLGTACLTANITFSGTVNKSFTGNVYNYYVEALGESTITSYKDSCEYPYIQTQGQGQEQDSTKSTVKIGTFVTY